jgi:hypothetical protein
MTTTPKSTSRTRQSDESIAAGSEPSAMMTKDEVLRALKTIARQAWSHRELSPPFNKDTRREMADISDKAIATIEALFDELARFDGMRVVCDRAIAAAKKAESELTTLCSRLERAEGDAKRYRWLRDQASDQDELACYTREFNDWGKSYWLLRCGETLDRIVNTALAAHSPDRGSSATGSDLSDRLGSERGEGEA